MERRELERHGKNERQSFHDRKAKDPQAPKKHIQTQKSTYTFGLLGKTSECQIGRQAGGNALEGALIAQKSEWLR